MTIFFTVIKKIENVLSTFLDNDSVEHGTSPLLTHIQSGEKILIIPEFSICFPVDKLTFQNCLESLRVAGVSEGIVEIRENIDGNLPNCGICRV